MSTLHELMREDVERQKEQADQREAVIRADERAKRQEDARYLASELGRLAAWVEATFNLVEPIPRPVKRSRRRLKPTDREIEVVHGFLVAQVAANDGTYWYPESIASSIAMNEALVRAACTTLVGAGKVESFQEGYKAIE